MTELYKEAAAVAEEIIAEAKLSRGQILVVGCSTSEILGSRIGTDSSPEAAKEVFSGIWDVLSSHGIYLAAQCCEHLNRALIVERSTAEKFGYEPVWVKPQPKAGGSFATTVWERMTDPVAVERIQAHAGMDVGATLIGMHLRRVAVPVRLSVSRIGEASLVCARTRPAYIGGPRAQYQTSEP